MTSEYKDLTVLEQRLLTMDVHAQQIRGAIIENDWTLEQWGEYRHLKNTYFNLRKYEESRRKRAERFRDMRRHDGR